MKKYVFLKIMAALVGLNCVAYSAETAKYKVLFKPTRMQTADFRLYLDVTTSLEPTPEGDVRRRIALGLDSILSELDSSFEKKDLDVFFDKETLAFRIQLKRAAKANEKKLGFSACISSWIAAQNPTTRLQFLDVISPGSTSNATDILKIESSLETYFNSAVSTCYKSNLAITFSDDVQFMTDEYVEKKSNGQAIEGDVKNLARVYDKAYELFNLESDNVLQNLLLESTTKYFNSFFKVGLNQAANINSLTQNLEAHKPLNSAKLMALTMGGFLDKSVISEAFESIQQSQKTADAFDQSLFWINRFANICAKELFVDPKGKECSSKLSTLNFYWLEFDRSGSEFKFLIAQ